MYYLMSLRMIPKEQCHLLLVTICCMMTSGHIMALVTDNHHHNQQHHHHQQHSRQHHHHHHHHQLYQQGDQKRYHLLSPVVGLSLSPVVVPGLHQSRNQRHLVIRRASRSLQHQHQRALNSQPIASATVKRTDNVQIVDELRALKKKRKRLRQLREEVRELSNYLQSKRINLRDDIAGRDPLKKYKTKEAHVRWRKQMTARVKAIMKRLRRLENGMKFDMNFTKGKRKMNGRLQILPVVLHATSTTSAPHAVLLKTTQDTKIKRLHSFLNQSKNGESGGICFGHKDCKPGLCCHRIFSVATNSSSSIETTMCRQYSLKEGELCKDSCQCEARLHCFRNSTNFKIASKSKHDSHAICKKVSTDDIVHGIYLNAEDSLFTVEQFGI